METAREIRFWKHHIARLPFALETNVNEIVIGWTFFIIASVLHNRLFLIG